MKLPHREVEDLRTDLVGWVNRHHQPGGIPMRSYVHTTRMAIYRLKKDPSIESAQGYLNRLLDAFRLNNGVRRAEAENNLSGYVDWIAESGTIVVQYKLRIAKDLGHDMTLIGEVPRIDLDVDDGGYNGILLGPAPADWRDQLRMPVLQAAIAEGLQRMPNEVAIGVQDLDGTGLQITQYSAAEIRDALAELRNLVATARRMLDAT